jgi:hypothetical protein
MKELKLDHNVPIPERLYRRGKHALLIEQMKIGDSFIVPDLHYCQSVRSALSQLKRRNPKYKNHRITSRKVKGGFRFWRIK